MPPMPPAPTPLTPEQLADVQKRAEAAAQERAERYEKEIGPILHRGFRTPDGQPTTLRRALEMQNERLKTGLPERVLRAIGDREVFEDEVRRRGGLLEIDLGNDRRSRLVLSGDGPVYLVGHAITAADTISTDEVLTSGASGFDLTGNAQLMGIWDETQVRRNHWEFGEGLPPSPSRVTLRDGAGAPSFHSTAVAGVMGAIGIIYNPPVGLITHGMAPLSDLWGYDWRDDEIEMDAAATEGLELSNHSYGAGCGWQAGQAAWFWYGHPGRSDRAFSHVPDSVVCRK